MNPLGTIASWPIRGKLLLLLAVTFLPAFGIIVSSGLEERNHEILAATRSAQLAVQGLAAKQEQIAIGTRQMLSTIAQFPEVQQLDVDACNQLFRELAERNPYYSVIAATTPAGMMCAGSSPFAPVDLSDRKHVQDAILTRDFSAGEYIVGRVSKVQSINYTYPVFDSERQLRGVVIAGFKLDEYARFMAKASLPDGCAITITDHKGVHLYRLPPDDGAVAGNPIPRDSFLRISGEQEQGTFEKIGEDGIDWVYAFKQLRLHENRPPYLYMIVGIPKAKILEAANSKMFRDLLILSIAAFLALSFAWAYGDFTLIRPLDRLVGAARLFGKGEMGARTGLSHTQDELGQLANAFDDMASLVEKRSIERARAEAELQKARDELESEVVRRTSELARVNESLKEKIAEREQAAKENEKLAEQLRQAQKMEAIGRLAGGVAHDFNNMLGVILGYAELLKFDPTIGDHRLKAVLEIEKAGLRSRDITRQLLAFSRKQIASPRPVDLNALIANMQKTLARLIGEDIELLFNPARELPRVNVDPSQIDQILVNLAVNGRDAMPRGGRLVMGTGVATLDAAHCGEHLGVEPGRYAMITVTDDGVGMDKETLSHIFEPFFTTKEVGKGTGLGLSTVYGIVRQNGGCINVYSEPGRGTVFKIYLPVMEAGEEQPVPVEPDETQAGGGTILLVEDDNMVRDMTVAMLKRFGYAVLAAENPSEALALFEKECGEIALLLTDVVLPGMSGKELAEKVEAIRPGTRVLFMSGYTSDVIVHRGILDEGINFIQKPFSMEGLARKIKELI